MIYQFLSLILLSQLTWQPLRSPTDSSLRGVSVSRQGTICATGSGPCVWVTQAAGDIWIDRTPQLSSVTDYRCAVIIDETTLLVASAGSPAFIMRSVDLGETWTTAYHNDHDSAFINSLHFWDNKRGIALGDPIDGKFLLLTTRDGGLSWTENDCGVKPLPGEAGFAASNGSIVLAGDSTAVIGLGGRVDTGPARVLRTEDAGKTWTVGELTGIPSGPSSGIFAIASQNGRFLIAVGGDHKKLDSPDGNLAISEDGGKSWRIATDNRPRGFRSSIIYVPADPAKPAPKDLRGESGYWIATGPSGTDVSVNGEDWKPLSNTGYHALHLTHEGHPLGVGSDGRIAVLREVSTETSDSDTAP